MTGEYRPIALLSSSNLFYISEQISVYNLFWDNKLLLDRSSKISKNIGFVKKINLIILGNILFHYITDSFCQTYIMGNWL